MPTIADVRAQYPQYQDMSDQQLAGALHSKFYSDMPVDQFNAKIGLDTQPHPAAVGDRSAELAAATSSQPSGLYNNATAGLNDLIYRAVGAPVDLANTALRGGAAALHAVGGPDIQLPVDTPGGHQSIADAFSKVGTNDPSKVVANGEGDIIARAAGAGVGAAIAPEAILAGLGKLGVVGPAAQELLGMIVGRGESPAAVAKNAIAGGAAGALAQDATDAAPAPLKPIAATVGALAGGGVASLATEAPAIVRAGVNVAKDFVAPMTQGGREQVAGKTLVNAAENPTAAIDALKPQPDLVPGSKPTTFQQSGDMGLGALERGVSAQNPADFMQRRADQNAARTSTMEGVQATGAPEQVAAAVTKHIEQLDQTLRQTTDAATAGAQMSATAIGAGVSPDVSGDAMRTSLESARAAAKTQERALWNAVDPHGTLALPVDEVKSQVASTLEKLPASAKPPTGEEAAIYQTVNQYGDVLPFSELTALKSRVGAEMRAERIANGESPAWGRLSQVAKAISGDMEKAIAGKVAEDNIAVASGRMAPADAISSRLTKYGEDYRNAFESNVGIAADSRQNAVGVSDRGGTSGASGVSGAAGQTGRGPSLPAGNPRLSGAGVASSFDQGALDRLKAASAATSSRVSTFDNKTLAPIRSRPGGASPYDMPGSAVPAKIFFPGQKSFDAINAYRAAVGDAQALPLIEQYAIDRLRKAALREDGTIDPAKLAAWRNSHADALRAFPQLDARLATAGKASETLLQTAAAAKATLDEAQKGTLGQIMGLHNPEDVTRTIGSIFARKDAIQQMARLRSAIAGKPDAEEGLRKAIIDFMIDRFVSNTESATSGLGALKSDQLQGFIAQNKGALHAAGFSNTELALMDNIAADLQRANRSIASLKLPGGSNTTQDVLAAHAMDSPSTMLTKILLASAVSGGGTGFVAGPLVGAATTIATGLIGVLRQNGLAKVNDLVKQAMLDPALARMLMMKVKPAEIKGAAMTIGQRFRRSAFSGAASVNSH